MNIMEVIIARLWSNLIYNSKRVYLKGKISKLKDRMYSSYRGIKSKIVPDTLQEDRFEAVCLILIEKYNLRRLNSPFSGHSLFLYDNFNQIWEIDKTNTEQTEVIIKKPESDIYNQVREYNELPILSIHKVIQKDELARMSVILK